MIRGPQYYYMEDHTRTSKPFPTYFFSKKGVNVLYSLLLNSLT